MGEVIIDFFAHRRVPSLSEAVDFRRCAGGAAANVAVAIAREGLHSAFVGSVGADPFGAYLRLELKKLGVDVSGLRMIPDRKTRLAFVSVSRNGERSFEFWERDAADTRLVISGPDFRKILKSSIVHFSSFLLLQEPSRTTALQTAVRVHRKGPIVCFDPNLRLSLWDSAKAARKILRRMVRQCHLLRLNDEEAYFLSGERSLTRAVSHLHHEGPTVVVVTMGAHGCYCSTPNGRMMIPAFKVKVVDTTGCGDAFLAGLLCGVARQRAPLDSINLKSWYNICLRANAMGALTATKEGAIPAIPDSRRVARFLKEHAS